MSETITINSLEDAVNFINNSAVASWPWGGGANSQGFAEYLLANHKEMDKGNFTTELKGYLLSVGEDPAEYALF